MKVALIALPWNDFRFPQASLGALTAYLRREEPGWEITAEHSYLEFALEDPDLYTVVATADFEGDRLYATLLYGQGIENIVSYWEQFAEHVRLGKLLRERKERGESIRNAVAALRARLDRHLDALVASRDWNDTVVGLTTSYSQLYANLTLAKRIKQTGANATIVMGGSTVSPASIADSLLRTYPQVDYIVRGEGELPLHALIKQVEAGGGALPPGVVSREQPAATGSMWQVPDLDSLPMPDYDTYYDRAPALAMSLMPIEGSRGCWWDRTTRNVKETCYFCNLNIQWDGFRQKSGKRVAAEMRELGRRYQRNRFEFLDNIVRVKGFDEFIDALGGLDMDPFVFHEARANLRPEQILRFAEVGLRKVQFGLEGLCNSFLDRIHKGTSTIMNLEVMKTCAELHISSLSNVIVDFPGSTQAEVEETLAIIDDYAFAYEPPFIAEFELGVDSVVARFPEQFGVMNLRNHELYGEVIPARDFATVQTFQYSFDRVAPPDWTPVVERVLRWTREYSRHPLMYLDGGSFIRVLKRVGSEKASQSIELTGEDADLYRFCLRIRGQNELHEQYGRGSADKAAEVDARLQRMVDQKLIYRDGTRYLSLACAPDPFVAAKRIRLQGQAVAARAPRKLGLVSSGSAC